MPALAHFCRLHPTRVPFPPNYAARALCLMEKSFWGMEGHPAVYRTIEQLSIRSIISIIYRPVKSNQPPRADPGPQNSPSSQQGRILYIALDERMGVSSIELFSSRNGSESCNENLKSELTLELYNSWRTVPRVPLAGFFPLRGVFQLAGGYFRGGVKYPRFFLAISRGGGNTPTSLHHAPCAPPQKNTATRPGRRTPLGPPPPSTLRHVNIQRIFHAPP